MLSIKRKGKFGGPKELPEQRRENAKQGERTQYQGDDGLESQKEEEQWQADALPANPQRASAKIACDIWSAVRNRN